MPSTPEAVVAGHICLDIIPRLPGQGDAAGLLTPGRLTIVGPAAVSTGGAVANTGLALHRLGLPVRLVGKVGEDPLGAALLQVLRGVAPHLADGMIVAAGESSSYTVVMNLPGQDRAFLHHPGANDTFQPGDLEARHLEGARWFHFGYPPLMRAMRGGGGAALEALFRMAKEAGLSTSLDMAYVDPASDAAQCDWRALLRRTLPLVDVFMPSLDEIGFMLGAAPQPGEPESIRAIARELLEMGAAIVALKLGSAGLYVAATSDTARLARTGPGIADAAAWAGLELMAPCFRVCEAGATGSGDCTIAGFIAALLRAQAPEDALLTAVGAGACCVEQPDATSGIIAWDALQQRIAAQWEQHGAAAAPQGFAWDSTRRVWRGGAQ
jgi:sugar/nucleoside kinase (ribokinase family)